MDSSRPAGKIVNFVTAAFILLWIYTAGSKLADFETYKLEMQHQVFSTGISKSLVFIIPLAEILAVGLLLFRKTNLAGLVFSLFMISAFTIYVMLIITGYFPRVPCSCGGVIRWLGWKGHLAFNLVFTILAVLALYYRPKREVGDNE